MNTLTADRPSVRLVQNDRIVAPGQKKPIPPGKEDSAVPKRLKGLKPARVVDRLQVCRAVVLIPTGDGSQDHLDNDVPAPPEIPLENGQFEVGREDSAQLTIRLPTVSARHAMLRVDGDKVTVTDLNSTNGTYIDDNELAPMKGETMTVGQEVIFGDMYLAKFQLTKRD